MPESGAGWARFLRLAALAGALAWSGCVSTSSIRDGRVSAAEAERVYDRATELVGRKFFDPAFGGHDWVALAREGRPAALAAREEPALYQAVNDVLQKLEVSHLVALTPREAVEMDRGERARIGLAWHKYPEGWVVEGVVPGGPAAEAGVEVGWLLVSVNGKPAEEAVRLRPTPGDRVVLECRDAQGVLRQVTLTARVLETTARPSEHVLPGGVVVLRFDEFEATSRRWLSAALKRHAGAPGVVLDLRRNHGGQLFSLDFVVGEFFTEARSTGTIVRRDGDADPSRARQWFSARYTGPLVVLVDDSTYSAAEILAHVLQQHQRATLVGRKSGGAVIVARYFRLPGGGRIIIPVYDYVGLDGKRLEGSGVTPDVEVKRDLKALREGRDVDLEAALTVLQGPGRKGSP